MASPPKIAVLNSILKVTPQERTFHMFPFLPKEIRLQIWEEAVPRERLLRVSLNVREEMQDDPPPRYLEKNHLGKPISGPRYRATAEGHQFNSKFLRVNKEAREVELKFHRVHLPFSFRAPGARRAEETTLYLSPEYDVLHIKADAPVKETLIDFFWDLRAYDPRDVGLLKMAIDLESFCANDLSYLKRSDLLLIRQRNILIETLSRLSELWFVYDEPWRARPPLVFDRLTQTTDTILNKPPAQFIRRDGPVMTLDVVPISSSIPTFDRVGHDRRQAAEYGLSNLYLGGVDPREIIWRWQRVLRTWQIHHQPEQVRYRLLVGRRPVSEHKTRHIETVDQAMEFVAVKDREVNKRAVLPDITKAEESCGERTVAVGYWLFPVEAVYDGEVGERLSATNFYRWACFDTREYWPELLLSRIG